ncbi:MAG: TrkH family potassium uptake protein [Micrococcales bacterium]|jgi:trk system potassium uptake protein|nr:TrkH family potassium uptake protein [Micrococcales bacterium]
MHPTQIVVFAFGAASIAGTLLLLLPFATAPGNSTSVVAAFFTAVSAVCITGLTVVDTATHWSGFGQLVIMVLIQLGGLGIVSFATLLGLLVSGRISLRDRLNTLSEAKIVGADSLPKLLSRILIVYFGFELVLATYLSLRLHFSYGEGVFQSIWHGTFHAISAFNNGGFSLYTDSMTGFNQDMFFIAPVMLAVVVGGLGFPVLIELHERIWRLRLQPGGKAKRFSLHTRLTLWMTVSLIVLGALFIGAIEWNNPGTLGGLNTWDKLVNTFFTSIMPRSGGFNSLDISAMDPASWLGIDLLMFIGGGSASTAGGIKVTTIAVLIFIIYTEIRGETAVNVGNRRLPRSIQRQALTLVALSATAILLTTLLFAATTDFSLDEILFDVISAAATVGLSTGITADLPAFHQIWLAFLMFVGRIGPVVVASALALRVTKRHYELPKERPLIG